MKRLGLIAVLALCAAACGAPTAKTYTAAATRSCLQKAAGVEVGPLPASDFVANSATGGGLHARLRDNAVTISFGLTLDDANNVDEAYRRFHAKNVGIDDILRTQQNAVMLWKRHPSDADMGTITGCLDG